MPPRAKRRRDAASEAAEAIKTGAAKEAATDAAIEAEDEDPRLIKTVPDLLAAFGFGETFRKKLPSVEDRNQGQLAEDDPGLRSMVNDVLAASVKMAELLYPGDPGLIQTLVGKKILGTGDRHRELGNLIEATTSVIRAAPKSSIQGRTARAILVKGASMKTLEELRKTKTITLGGGTQNRAYKDFDACARGELLHRAAKQARTRFDDDAARHAVQFMLAAENSIAIPSRARDVRLSADEVVHLPTLVRKKPESVLYEDYCRCAADQSWETISRSSFYFVMANILTRGEEVLAAEDVANGMLINDTRERLQDIINDFAEDAEARKALSTHLEVAIDFLKVHFNAHALKGAAGAVATHDFEFGLREPDSAVSARAGKCAPCDFPFFFLQELRGAVAKDAETERPRYPRERALDALQVLDDSEEKFLLYQGHRMRAEQQQVAIDMVDTDLRRRALEGDSSSAIVVIDWNNLTSSRETVHHQQERFGKRGCSWHGALISFYRSCTLTPQDAAEESSLERIDVYLDQIVDGDIEENALTVASMLEAMLEWVGQHLPHIREVILQSGNAACYASMQLPVLISLVNTRAAVKVVRYIRGTETQHGKLRLNAHFAGAMRHVVKFMRASHHRKRVRAIATPRGLAAALAWRQGMQNSAVQLVEIDQAKHAELLGLAGPATSAMERRGLDQGSDIHFMPPEEPALTSTRDLRMAVEARREFCFRSFAYPGIGKGSTCTFELAAAGATGGSGDNDGGNDDNGDGGGKGEINDDEAGACGAASSVVDYVIDGTIDPVTVVLWNGRDKDEDTDEEEAEAEDVDLDVPAHAQDTYMYGATQESFESRTTGVKVIRASNVRALLGPRDAARRQRQSAHAGPKAPRRVDLLAFAVRTVAHELTTSAVRAGEGDVAEYALANDFPTRPRLQGWARRPPRGQQFGANYAQRYLEQITALVDGSAKLGPAQIRERLSSGSDARYSLPSVDEIQTHVSALAAAKKAKPSSPNQAAAGKRGRKSNVPDEVHSFLETLVSSQPTTKPRHAAEAIRETFPDLVGLDGAALTDQQLKIAFNGAKKRLQQATDDD